MNNKRLYFKMIFVLVSFFLLSQIWFVNKLVVNATGTIADVTGLQWVEGSKATASWNASNEANYYSVIVQVYENDGVTPVGSTTTGTGATELDVQQEIHNVIGNAQYENVKVLIKVVAQKKKDDVVIAESNGLTSGLWTYAMNALIRINTPTNVRISNDNIALFDYDIENPQQAVKHIGITIQLSRTTGSTFETYGSSFEYYYEDIEWNNGTARADITSVLAKAYKGFAKTGEVDAKIGITIVGNEGYGNSNYVESTNSIKYTGSLKPIPTPTNITITNDYKAVFNYSIDNPKKAIEHIGITIQLIAANGDTYGCGSDYYYDDVEWNNGTARIDISNAIASAYKGFAKTGEVDVKCGITIIGSDGYGNSNYAESANTIKYIGNTKSITNPTNIRITEDYKAVFNYSIDDPKKVIEHIGITIQLIAPNGDTYGTGSDYYYGDVEWNNGIARIDISNAIAQAYKGFGQKGEVEVKIGVTIIGNEGYGNSSYAESSNSIVFNGNIKVQSISISQDNPIICKGRSYFLGKTITPTNAYYKNIEWSSDNSNIVSVDSNGRITGISVGTARITAKIGDAKDTVTVSVYEISTNLENANDNQIVTEAAGDIIDDIVNNDNPDINDTDINLGDLAQLKEEIQNGVENGDSFHTDISYMQEYFETYKNNWGQIQKAAGDLNAQFEGAYDIEVEMYHKDKTNQEHHIGNITELDDEISFSFDLPTGMKEKESGNTKKYVLVRVHKNSKGVIEYDTVDYSINGDGTATAKSDKYSDFVWVSVTSESPYSQIQEFVKRFYIVILQRPYDEEGLNNWTNALITKKMTATDVAYGFVFSDEFIDKNYSPEEYVARLYSAFFNREAANDPDGANLWISSLKQGKSREYVFAGFVGSDEFKNLCASYGIEAGEYIPNEDNSNNQTQQQQENPQPTQSGIRIDASGVDPAKLDEFMERLYNEALGRPSDPQGKQDWANAILSGQYDAGTVARYGFFASEEYISKNKTPEEFVHDAYRAFFGRDEDQGGFDMWVNGLKDGTYTRDQVIEKGFGYSDEFIALLESYGFKVYR